MRRTVPALICGLALATGLGACGGDDGVADVVPKNPPALTAPEDSGLGPAASATDTTATTSTTATTDTTATTPAAATPATPTPAAPATPTPNPATPPAATTPPANAPDSGGFSDFCQQNPGACPDQ